MNVLMLLDLTRLYFTARALRVDIDYARLVYELKIGLGHTQDTVEVVGFTTSFSNSIPQQVFLDALEAVGIRLVKYAPRQGKDNYLSEMLAFSDADGAEALVLVTNAEDTLQAKSLYADSDKTCSVAYFVEHTPSSWSKHPALVDVYNLSATEVLRRIVADPSAVLERRALAQLRLPLGA